jgi:hypothetical protein
MQAVANLQYFLVGSELGDRKTRLEGADRCRSVICEDGTLIQTFLCVQ